MIEIRKIVEYRNLITALHESIEARVDEAAAVLCGHGDIDLRFNRFLNRNGLMPTAGLFRQPHGGARARVGAKTAREALVSAGDALCRSFPKGIRKQ
jgi:hypothetical protein